jgi:hypothetical protein
VTPSARASSSIQTASGPPAASARSPSSIQLLRGVRVGADIAYQYRVPHGVDNATDDGLEALSASLDLPGSSGSSEE